MNDETLRDTLWSGLHSKGNESFVDWSRQEL